MSISSCTTRPWVRTRRVAHRMTIWRRRGSLIWAVEQASPALSQESSRSEMAVIRSMTLLRRTSDGLAVRTGEIRASSNRARTAALSIF